METREHRPRLSAPGVIHRPSLRHLPFCYVIALALFPVCVIGQTLAEALNATNLTWTTSGTGGANGWIPQTTTTHDGTAAARSGTVVNSGQTSTVQTTVNGPGTLSFWWSEPSKGYVLDFYIDNLIQTNLSGFMSWRQQTFYLGSGSQALKWVLSTFSLGTGNAVGYLDEVTYAPGTTAPLIITQPQSQSQGQGLNATFRVAASGTPPLAYQWNLGGAELPGATNTSLTVTNVQLANLGAYQVMITSAAETVVSSNAYLEFGQVTSWGFDGHGVTSIVPGATNVLAISAGAYQCVALKTDGVILGWGLNDEGQSVATNIAQAIALDAGGKYNLALTSSNTVIGWGRDQFGEALPPIGLSNVVAVRAGGSHSLALLSDGNVMAWGDNSYGQTNVPIWLSNVVAVAAGSLHTLALRADGSVVGWGYNCCGQTNVPAGLSNVVAVAAGDTHSLALRSDGSVVAWGFNTPYGQTTIPAGLTNVVAISCGNLHSMALRSDGSVVAWGRNLEGQTNVPSGLTNVIAISGGGYHSLALVGNGPPVTAALVLNPTLSTNGFALTMPSDSGRVYALEYRTALSNASHWQPLPLVAGTGTNLVLRDPAAGDSQRFYRVRRW